MSVLANLEPKKVFSFFEEICGIPHGSGNMRGITEYLVSFAKERNLKWYQDEAYNVVIYKAASKGYENAPVVILQGHEDMVAEKTPESTHNFLTDGLKLKVEGDEISAEDTTLGADNGIAVAMMLAILDDDSLLHPALECVITADEEIGLIGAGALDTSVLHGNYMINLDSGNDENVWVSCAGGVAGTTELPVSYREEEGFVLDIVMDGLQGGHSGADIHLIRANANKIMGRFLLELGNEVNYGIVTFEGGTKDNAIPRRCSLTIVIDPNEYETVVNFAENFQKAVRNEYVGSDENLMISVMKKEIGSAQVLDPISHEKVVFYLMQVPYGVQKMSGSMKDLVETSCNLGILKLDEEKLIAVNSIRSSVKTAKWNLSQQIQYLTEFLGGTYWLEGEYPGWEFRKDSKLREIAMETYREMYGNEMEVQAIHAGLECGLFYDKIENLDCISYGVNAKACHTTEESLSISSTYKVWNYLTRLLEKMHS